MSLNPKSNENKEVLDLLAEIYQTEMSGVSQYLHYSFMIMGYNRIPIQKWFRDNAQESMTHAIEIGEKMTSLGGHPPIVIPKVEERNDHSIRQLLNESLRLEENAIGLYKKLIGLASKYEDVALEEMARSYVKMEIEHYDEVRKMLRSND
jgi:bacterioferritin